MKEWIAMALALSMVLPMAACAKKEEPPAASTVATEVPTETTLPEAMEVTPQVDLKQLEEDLKALTQYSRPAGSDGEKAAADYIFQRLEQMGYQVSTQSLGEKDGTNVVAIRDCQDPKGDILVISAHHDTVPGSRGANDDATGVAALLAVAQTLKDVNTDTQLRLVSFTAAEKGKAGSQYYLQTLTQEEKSRMVGCIHLDMLGGPGTEGLRLCTLDAQSNWLTELIREQMSLDLGAQGGSDHASFQLAGVPSVMLTQKGKGYLYHTTADRASQQDLHAISQAAKVVSAAAQKLASDSTPSCQRLAHRQGANYTYFQTRRSVIPFGKTLAYIQSAMGDTGELTGQWEETVEGRKVSWDTYRYSVRWFNGKTPMNSYYRFRDGLLEDVLICPGETGYTLEQIHTLLTARYGEPGRTGQSAEGEPWESWQDGIYGKHILLEGQGQDFTVTVSAYAEDISNTLGHYEVKNGQARVTDTKHAEAWSLLCQILPESCRQKIAQFRVFSDGWGGAVAYADPLREGHTADNSRFMISVDYYDIYDENGNPRDLSRVTYALLCTCGQILLEDESQLDFTAGEDGNDPAAFVEGSLRKAFYDAFWAVPEGQYPVEWENCPEAFVSGQGASSFREDICQTFAVFLLGDQPDGDTVAEEKLLLFWQDPQMVSLRQQIRQGLGLD